MRLSTRNAMALAALFSAMAGARARAATLSDLLGGKTALQTYRNGGDVRVRNLNTGQDWKVFTPSTISGVGGINLDATKLVTMNGDRPCVVDLDGGNHQYVAPSGAQSPHFWRDANTGEDWVVYNNETDRYYYKANPQDGTTWKVRINSSTNAPVESTRVKLVSYQYQCGMGGSGVYLGDVYKESRLYNLVTGDQSPWLNGVQNCVGSMHPGSEPWMMYEKDDGHHDVVISEWNESSNTARYIWQYHSSSDVYGLWSSTDGNYCTITKGGQLYLVKLQVDTSGTGNRTGSYQEAAMGISYGYLGGVHVSAGGPRLSLSPGSLSFSAVEGGGNPSDRTVSVTNSGSDTLDAVSASEGASWLTVSRSGSGNSQTLTNSVNISGLSPETYTATVQVSCGNAANSPQTCAVTLTVTGPPVLTTIEVVPASTAVEPWETVQFAAHAEDQNGDPFAAVISWSVAGGGSMSPTSSGSAVTEHTSTFISDGTEGTFTVTASSAGVQGTSMVVVSTQAAFHVKVNCGSNSYDVAGWERDDAYVSGGEDWTNPDTVDTAGVPNAAPPNVYKSVRHRITATGSYPTFTFPGVSNGSYVVRLHFSDKYPGATHINVDIEGQTALTDYDIVGNAGGTNKAVTEDLQVNVVDGDGMTIALSAEGGGDSYVGGIEIISGGGPGDNNAPAVNAGANQTITLPTDTADLNGTVTDDGLPDPPGQVTATWTKVSGPGTVTFGDASAPQTAATFSEAGTYVLRLSADDGEKQSSDDLTVTVEAATVPSITITAPNGGEAWTAGTTQHIRWSTVESSDVTIEYSTDGGSTWKLIAGSVDVSQIGWLDYEWTVPNEPSTLVLVRISDYLDHGLYDESDAPFEIVSAFVDVDSDGLPDSWEEEHFGSVDACDPDDDPDADGLSNLEEYAAGSDPNDPDTDGDGLLDGDDASPTLPPDPFHGNGGACGAGFPALAALLLLVRRRPQG